MGTLQSCWDVLNEIIGRILFVFSKLLGLVWGSKNDEDVVRVGKVEVYILLGQSNMLGEGALNPENKDGTLANAVSRGLYPYLIDSEKKWVTSNTVRNVRVMDGRDGKMHVFNNEFLNASRSEKIGPEVGIGFMLEKASPDAPILLLKSCIGNRSLG